MACKKFQRKEQRGGILFREQQLASVYISVLQNFLLTLTGRTLRPQGSAFSGNRGDVLEMKVWAQ